MFSFLLQAATEAAGEESGSGAAGNTVSEAADTAREVGTAVAEQAVVTAEKASALMHAAATDIRDIMSFYPEVTIWVFLAIGVIYVLAGYRWFGMLLSATGIIIGGFGGMTLCNFINAMMAAGGELATDLVDTATGVSTTTAADEPTIHPIIGVIVGAVVLGILSQALFKLTLFLLGSFSGFWIGYYTIFAIVGPEDQYTWLYIGGVALVGGIVALFMERPILILSTSLTGSFMLVLAGLMAIVIVEGENSATVDKLVFNPNSTVKTGEQGYVLLIVFVLIALAGIFLQWKKTGKEMKFKPKKYEQR
ncbi:MAG: TMEM198/TM7SF3 family protein [Planctomycetes bacterium]|nr:TMEM198/TM7SF3 family protein [Planctomycetota bacterium]